jgi:hypothetical protein
MFISLMNQSTQQTGPILSHPEPMALTGEGISQLTGHFRGFDRRVEVAFDWEQYLGATIGN